MKKMHRAMAVVCVLVAMACGAEAGTIRYVDANVSGGLNNGSSWANAYTSLQSAIAASVANSGDEIWVARGTYYPAAAGSLSTYFTPKSGTSLYGGFTNGMAFAQRNWDAYPAILSGDIDKDGLLDTDNSYVVVYTYAANNWRVDGFTVTMGARGAATGSGGAGIHSGNSAAGAGTVGIVANCRVVSNACITTTGTSGGGMYISGGSQADPTRITITNCTFSQNSAFGNSSAGGGGLLLYSGNTKVVDCKFFGNRTWGNGSALAVYRSPAARIENCVFAGNVSTGGGAAVELKTSSATLPIRDVVLTNCVFSGNTAFKDSSALVIGSTCITNVTVVGCTFSGNAITNTANSGGAVQVNKTDGNPVPIRNCLFAGNYAAANYSALQGYQTHKRIDVDSSVFAYNRSGNGKGVVTFNVAGNTIRNSIFWGNRMTATPTNIYSPAAASVSYTDLQGGFGTASVSSTIQDGGGNLDTLPGFADGPAGTWTAAGVYNAQTGQTALKHAGAGWNVNRWAGTLINPNTTQSLQYYVASNTSDTLYMWGDASAIATLGAAYQGYDYHLKSLYGRYTAVGWETDVTSSPLIDKGDPLSDYALEPEHNGGQINIGVYGNTAQASKSIPPHPRGTCVVIR